MSNLEVWEVYQKAQQEKFSLIVATLVRCKGSSFRDVGDKMAFLPNGQIIGTLGKCLASILMEKAQNLFFHAQSDQETELVSLSFDEEQEAFWELGLGCGSHWEILLERLPRSHSANEPFWVGMGIKMRMQSWKPR